MHCRLVVPEGVLFDGEASLIAARSSHGEFAVMDHHAPLLAELVPSPLRIKTEATEHIYVLSSGLLRVEETGVTITAEQAVPLGEIELTEVRRRRSDLDERLKSAPGDENLLRERETLNLQERIKEQHG